MMVISLKPENAKFMIENCDAFSTCEDKVLQELTSDSAGPDHQDLAVSYILLEGVLKHSVHLSHCSPVNFSEMGIVHKIQLQEITGVVSILFILFKWRCTYDGY